MNKYLRYSLLIITAIILIITLVHKANCESVFYKDGTLNHSCQVIFGLGLPYILFIIAIVSVFIYFLVGTKNDKENNKPTN